MTEYEKELWEERAAILEYEAGYDRGEAEEIAYQMIMMSRNTLEEEA